MIQRQYELMDRGTNPYVPAQERKEAIGEYISLKEHGESSGTAMAMHVDPTQEEKEEHQVGFLTQTEGTTTQTTSQAVVTEGRMEQGIKRKTPEDEEDIVATSSKRLEIEQPNYGSAVLLKPQGHP